MKSFEDVNLSGIYDEQCDLSLENMYNQCNAEMGLQQSKRDQIIAFYIAIISFLVPAIIDLELPFLAQSVAYGLLWVIGIVLCAVVRRYRVYKETYWLTLRTISTLMRVKRKCINENVIKKLFSQTMRMLCPTVVKSKENADRYTGLDQIDYEATRKKNSGSAEFLLYRLIVLISSVVLAIAVYSFTQGLLQGEWSALSQELTVVVAVIVSAVPAYCFYTKCEQQFITELCGIYAYCYDKRWESFEKVFLRAWFLHSSIEKEDAKQK